METMVLLGAEQVSSAGHTMRDAAAEMRRAAESLDYSLQQQRQFMDDWLLRLEAVLEKNKPLSEASQ